MANGIDYNEEGKSLFSRLILSIQKVEATVARLAEKITKMEGIGGGSASIEDYEEGKVYKRNTLVVSPTEVVYRVVTRPSYTSVNFEQDRANGHLMLVGFESQIVTFDHLPTQKEIDVLPEDTLVAIYSTTDDPYNPVLSTDNFNNE